MQQCYAIQRFKIYLESGIYGKCISQHTSYIEWFLICPQECIIHDHIDRASSAKILVANVLFAQEYLCEIKLKKLEAS